jgi:hypothetical protein
MSSRVMYIELKADGVRGPARIGRVELSKTGKTLYYAGRTLAPLKGHGLKANYFDTETLEEFWISGPKANGTDSLYGAGARGPGCSFWGAYGGAPRPSSGEDASRIPRGQRQPGSNERGIGAAA